MERHHSAVQRGSTSQRSRWLQRRCPAGLGAGVADALDRPVPQNRTAFKPFGRPQGAPLGRVVPKVHSLVVRTTTESPAGGRMVLYRSVLEGNLTSDLDSCDPCGSAYDASREGSRPHSLRTTRSRPLIQLRSRVMRVCGGSWHQATRPRSTLSIRCSAKRHCRGSQSADEFSVRYRSLLHTDPYARVR